MDFSDALLWLAAFVAGLNLFAFMAMVWDKECAKAGMSRVPELFLLAQALLGGSIGTIAGQRLWRHKTRKEPFRTYLRMIVIIQFTVLASLAFPGVRAAVWAYLPQVPG